MSEVDSRDIKAGLMELAIAVLKGADTIAQAIHRHADVYLYVNDPEGDEAEQPQAARTLPDGFKGMR